MKKLIYISTVLALLGCTKVDEFRSSGAEGVITFSASDISSRVHDEGSTLSWASGEGVCVMQGATGEKAYYTVTDTLTGDMSYTSGSVFYTNANNSQTFYAWAPDTLTVTSSNISLDLSKQTEVNQIVVGSASTNTTTATLAFEPVYTKVVFNITAGGMDIVDLTGATAILEGANVKGNYNLADGSFSWLSSEKLTPELIVDAGGFTATVTVYVLETTSMNGYLRIDLGSETFITSLTNKSWSKGNMYEYTFALGDKAPIMTLADFGTTYTASALPTEDTWIITDSGDPTTSEFSNLKSILNTLQNRKIDLVFPSLNSFPDEAFENAYALNSFTAPNLRSIGAHAFSGCSGFTGDLTIPDGVTSIGIQAFYGCTGFKGTLTLSSELISIDYGAFSDCSGFTGSLIIPSGVTSIGDWAFNLCSGFTGSLTIPDGVTSIGYWAFNLCSGFTGSLTLPSGLTTIGRAAFFSCSGFTGDLTIPSSVTSIGSSAFSGCSGFTGSLTLPSELTSIGQAAFYGCTGFKGTLTLSSELTSIGQDAFSGCSGLTGSLTIPSGVTSIEQAAFSGCSGLTGSLAIPSSVTSIGQDAFSGCSGLTGDLTIPDGVTSIGIQAFFGCSGLTGSLAIPDGVTSIGIQTFSGCSGFTGDLIIPSEVTSIGISAFYGCTGFKGTLTLSSELTSIGKAAFSGCSGFTGDLTIPDGVTSIGIQAFYGCTGFKGTLTLSSELISIDYGAFSDCSGFTGSLIIPSGVTSIGSYAFTGCSSISAIIAQWESEIPTIISNSFPTGFKVSGGSSISIPAGTLSAYNAVSGWSSYSLLERSE